MKKIIIDPGHGGDDDGASYGFVDEDDTNLSISNLIYLMLQLQGFHVDLTRDKDEKVELSERVSMANHINADAFISIHCDAFHNTTVSGMSVHIAPKASETSNKLAHNILDQMAWKFPDHNLRGVKKSNFYVVRNTIMPAVLVECEFLSNPETKDFLKEPENQYSMAEAITKGVYNIFKN